MATLKKTARKSAEGTTRNSTEKNSGAKTSRTRNSSAGSQAQAQRVGNSITESAQQIWLAGMGAFNRAQAEGGKLFESLVRDGLSLEQTARKFAGNRAEIVRDVVEGRVSQARERAADTWDKLENVFEDRVQRALVKLGVPGQEDLDSLVDRVDRLTAELRKANRKPAARPAQSATASRQAVKPRAKATPKAPAKQARKRVSKRGVSG